MRKRCQLKTRHGGFPCIFEERHEGICLDLTDTVSGSDPRVIRSDETPTLVRLSLLELNRRIFVTTI